jgi:predicted Zn-dependent protease
MNRSNFVMLAIGSLAIGATGCSTIANLRSPAGAISAATDVGANQAKCAPILTEQTPSSEEIAVGGAIAVNWLKNGNGVYAAGNPDNDITAYLNLVGKNLAFHSVRPHLPWTFGVVESEGVNAYSSPGGYVLVTRGLLKHVKSEAELAGILAHEIAHVNRRHALEQYKKAKYGACTAGGLGQTVATNEAGAAGAALTSTDLFKKVVDQAVDGIMKGYSRDLEFEADADALRLIVRVGYDPKPFLAFLGALPGGGGIFDNHPPSAERVQRLQAQIDHLKVEEPFLATFDAPKAVPLKGELSSLK